MGVYIDAYMIIHVCAEREGTNTAKRKPPLDSLQLYIVPFSDLRCVFGNFHSAMGRGIQKSNTERSTRDIVNPMAKHLLEPQSCPKRLTRIGADVNGFTEQL